MHRRRHTRCVQSQNSLGVVVELPLWFCRIPLIRMSRSETLPRLEGDSTPRARVSLVVQREGVFKNNVKEKWKTRSRRGAKTRERRGRGAGVDLAVEAKRGWSCESQGSRVVSETSAPPDGSEEVQREERIK